MQREVELKAVVEDLAGCRRRLEAAGGQLVFEGRLEDRRYDTINGRLSAGDEVLRIRTHRDTQGTRTSLDWKGSARREHGYKVRDEIVAHTSSAAELASILERLGFGVTGAIDREVAQYEYAGAQVRFERYPRMDTLVEVEGQPDAIERAITALGMPREGFTSERLVAFVERFEARTGIRASISDRQLAGEEREETRG